MKDNEFYDFLCDTVVIVARALVCMVLAVVFGYVAKSLGDAKILWWEILPAFLYLFV